MLPRPTLVSTLLQKAFNRGCYKTGLRKTIHYIYSLPAKRSRLVARIIPYTSAHHFQADNQTIDQFLVEKHLRDINAYFDKTYGQDKRYKDTLYNEALDTLIYKRLKSNQKASYTKLNYLLYNLIDNPLEPTIDKARINALLTDLIRDTLSLDYGIIVTTSAYILRTIVYKSIKLMLVIYNKIGKSVPAYSYCLIACYTPQAFIAISDIKQQYIFLRNKDKPTLINQFYRISTYSFFKRDRQDDP